MYTSEELLKKVEVALAALTADQPSRKRLYEPVEYILSLGGKRLRPVLLLMAYNIYKVEVEEAMMPAVGLETFHNFTLLHDDLMDRAEFRRGKPCVHKVWDDNVAILSGDSMLLLAYQCVAKCGRELEKTLKLFTDTALEIHEGQQYDLDFESRNDVSEGEYIEMIRLKTSVLLACALKMGALLADAPAADQDALYDFGINVGLAFQLQDDYLDVYGDFATFGKRIGGDILCNKKTFMLINALQKADAPERRELDAWIAATDYEPEEKIKAVTEIYTKVGVGEMALARIEAYYREAEKCLARLSVPAERTKPLWGYVQSMLGRQS